MKSDCCFQLKAKIYIARFHVPFHPDAIALRILTKDDEVIDAI